MIEGRRHGAGKQFAAVINRIFRGGAYQSQSEFGRSGFAPGFGPFTIGFDSSPEALTPSPSPIQWARVASDSPRSRRRERDFWWTAYPGRCHGLLSGAPPGLGPGVAWPRFRLDPEAEQHKPKCRRQDSEGGKRRAGWWHSAGA